MGPTIKKDHKLSFQIIPIPKITKQLIIETHKNNVLIPNTLGYKVKNLLLYAQSTAGNLISQNPQNVIFVAVSKLIFYPLIALLLMVSCVENRRSLDSNTIYAHLNSKPDGLHPTNKSSGPHQFISTLIHKTLYHVDLRTNEIVPSLSIGAPNISADGKVYKYQLRKDVKWDNGKPFTAKDVEFTLKTIMHDLTNNPNMKPVFRSVIDSVKLYPDDPFKLDIIMLGKNVSNGTVMSDVYIIQQNFYDPGSLLEKVYFSDIKNPNKKWSKKIEKYFEVYNSPQNNLEPQKINGLGPYKVIAWEDNALRLIKKKNWWGENDSSIYNHQNPDTIVFRIITEDHNTYMELKRGDLDVSTKLSTKDLIRLQNSKAFNEQYYSEFADQFAYVYIGLNTKPDGIKRKAVFAEKKVRQAIAHLVPVDDIIEVMLYGKAERQVANISPLASYYNRKLKPIPLNHKKAEKLLNEAGWIDSDGDNIRDKMINGEKIKLSFQLNYITNADYEAMALMIKDEMAKVGVEVNPNSLEFGTFYGNALQHDFDAMIGSWQGSALYSDMSQLWSTEAWATKGYNFTGFGNAHTDSLIRYVNSQIDPEKFKTAIQEFQAVLYEEQPYVFMYQIKKKVAIHHRISNPKVYAEKPGVVLQALQIGGNAKRISS